MLSSSIGCPKDDHESRPLLSSLSEATVSRTWFIFAVGALVAVWCALDSWNHDMSSRLFQFSEQGTMSQGHSILTKEPFKYALTLAFLQFAFSGLVFCFLFAVKAGASTNGFRATLAANVHSVANWRWPSLVVTHLFSSVLLQSLMLPKQMMSLSFFAATRAIEVPAAAVARANVFKLNGGGHELRTVLFMAAAAWLLFYSYSQIAECLCIWSGFGVAITGLPLYFAYALILTIPATNTVLQEAVLVQLQACPLFMQGVSNVFAALLFAPMLLAAHWVGYEDVWRAINVVGGHTEAFMTVLWLCVETVFISAVTVCLVTMVDSFWTVASRSLRVVFWWARQMFYFYLSSSTLLSVAQPHASLWSFGIVSGILLAGIALATDAPKHHDEDATKGCAVGKYV